MKRIAFNLIATAGVAWFLASCTLPQYSPVEATEVINVGNQKQRDIYNRSRQWFSQYFVSGESVVDYEDPEAGTIIGNGVAKVGSDPFGIIRYNIHYNIRIDTKDGRFKVTTKIIKHTNSDNERTYDVAYVPKSREDMAARHIAKVVGDIKSYVSSAQMGSAANW
jgi:hypothetical protein